MNTETRLTVAEERAERTARLAADLDARTDALLAVLPSVMSVERFKRVVIQAISRNPDVLNCTRESIILAVMDAASLGLEPTGPYGGGHLVPFHNNTTDRDEAVFIADYRGLVALALRQKEVVDVEARIVFEGDAFELQLGSEPFVRHIPAFARDDPNRGGYRGVYTLIRYRDPAVPPHIDYMTIAEIEQVRDRTRGKGRKGPWADWFDEMAKKTALRRALKVRSTTPEMAEVLAREDAIEPVPDEAPVPSERRQRLVSRIVPETVREDVPSEENTPALGIVEAESLPAFEDLVEERDPTACGDPSPFGDGTCTEPIDHPGIHRIGESESWPRT